MATRIALSLWLLTFALIALFLTLVVLSRDSPGPLEYDSELLITALFTMTMLMFSSLGALILARQPGNSIGWLFCFTGVASSAGLSAQLYADYALLNHLGTVPGGELAAWVSSWLPISGIYVTPAFLPFLFPDGRPPSKRWRLVVRVLIAAVVIGLAGVMFAPGPIEPFESVPNPLGLQGATGRALVTIDTAFSLFAIPAFLVGGVAIVTRLRAARGEPRLQLKWFAYAAAIMGIGFAGSFAAAAFDLLDLSEILFLLGAVALAGLPVASAIAILRYRLYDIDLIINRTLVYVSVSAFLGIVYYGLVVSAQRIVGTDSPLVVAGSTLAIAALFRPARARIQAGIDRRFNRRKYDAARTIESFSAHLRDEVDLDSLTEHLLGVVHDTMEPARVSLWLRRPV